MAVPMAHERRFHSPAFRVPQPAATPHLHQSCNAGSSLPLSRENMIIWHGHIRREPQGQLKDQDMAALVGVLLMYN